MIVPSLVTGAFFVIERLRHAVNGHFALHGGTKAGAIRQAARHNTLRTIQRTVRRDYGDVLKRFFCYLVASNPLQHLGCSNRDGVFSQILTDLRNQRRVIRKACADKRRGARGAFVDQLIKTRLLLDAHCTQKCNDHQNNRQGCACNDQRIPPFFPSVASVLLHTSSPYPIDCVRIPSRGL
ncbi:MAG: hypothetical protein RR825_06575 [Ruthenibacterium sp.]